MRFFNNSKLYPVIKYVLVAVQSNKQEKEQLLLRVVIWLD